MKARPEKLKEKGANCTFEIQTFENMSDGLGWGGQSTVSERNSGASKRNDLHAEEMARLCCTLPEAPTERLKGWDDSKALN